jgi:hypothetical protein
MRRLLSGVILVLLVLSILASAFRIQPIRASPVTTVVPDDYHTMQAAVERAPSTTSFVAATQSRDLNDSEAPIAKADVSDSLLQSGTGIVQTRLKLFVLLNDLLLTSAIAAYLTDNNGNPIAGEVIAFSITEAPLRLMQGWFGLGTGVTDTNGVAFCAVGIGFHDAYDRNWVFKARHEQNMSLSASEDMVYVTFPGETVIHIRSDGSIDPPSAPIERNGDSYVLTDDITTDHAGISIEKSNIALYGAGHLIHPIPCLFGLYGIALNGMTNVTIRDVQISSFGVSIDLSDCVNCTIEDSTLVAPEWPAFLWKKWNWWSLASCMWGVNLDGSSNNSIFGNSVINTYGAFVEFWEPSSGNRIYHNNFINTTYAQFDTSYDSVNQWDDGYPSGGNFWSDYTGFDNCSGPYQNMTGTDGIGDVPYIINVNNTDRYPLMDAWLVQNYRLTVASVSGGTTDPAPWTYYYDSPTDVSARAIPSINYEFDHWVYNGGSIGSENPVTIHVDNITSLTAVFRLIMFNLTVEASTGGTTNPTPGSYTCASGTNASITALPDIGYKLDYWLLDGTPDGSTEPFNIQMTQNCSLKAVFVRAPPPQANFTYSPIPPVNGQTVAFDASGSVSGSRGFTAYVWDFNEGTITTTAGPIVTYAFAQGGNHNVTLTVIDSDRLNETVWEVVEVLQHDVAVTNILPYHEWVYEGKMLMVNMTVGNRGNFTESITARLYYNVSADQQIGISTFDLDPGDSSTVTFTWNTTGVPPCYSGYDLTAVVDIPTEIDSNMTNNVLQSPLKVQVRILGDINGDGTVDGKDISIVARSFGSCGPNYLFSGSAPSPRWNLDADINGDNVVDGRDLVLVARNFGK